jgi:hypothetical protein
LSIKPKSSSKHITEMTSFEKLIAEINNLPINWWSHLKPDGNVVMTMNVDGDDFQVDIDYSNVVSEGVIKINLENINQSSKKIYKSESRTIKIT